MKRNDIFRRFLRHKLGVVSLIVTAIIVAAAVLAPVIAPYDPNAVNPSFNSPPSAQYWLGT